MVALSVFGSELGAPRQTVMVLLLLFLYLVLEVWGKPFRQSDNKNSHSVLQKLELSALFVEWTTFWCGLMMFMSSTSSDSEGIYTTMVVYSITANGVLFSWMLKVLFSFYIEENKDVRIVKAFLEMIHVMKCHGNTREAQNECLEGHITATPNASQISSIESSQEHVEYVEDTTFYTENPISKELMEVEMSEYPQSHPQFFWRYLTSDGTPYFFETESGSSVWELPPGAIVRSPFQQRKTEDGEDY